MIILQVSDEPAILGELWHLPNSHERAPTDPSQPNRLGRQQREQPTTAMIGAFTGPQMACRCSRVLTRRFYLGLIDSILASGLAKIRLYRGQQHRNFMEGCVDLRLPYGLQWASVDLNVFALIVGVSPLPVLNACVELFTLLVVLNSLPRAVLHSKPVVVMMMALFHKSLFT